MEHSPRAAASRVAQTLRPLLALIENPGVWDDVEDRPHDQRTVELAILLDRAIRLALSVARRSNRAHYTIVVEE